MTVHRVVHPFPDNIAWKLMVTYCALAPLLILPMGGVLYGLCDILLPVSLAVLLLEYLLGGIRLHVPALILAGYLGVVCISAFNLITVPTYPAFFRVVRLSGIFMPFFLGASARFSDGYHLRRLLDAFFAGATASVVVGIVFFFLGIAVKTNMQKYDYSGQLHLRAGGLFGDSGAYGTLCALWLCLVLARALRTGLGFAKLIMLSCYMLVGLLTAYVSLSRLEVFSVAIGVLLLPVLCWASRCRLTASFLRRWAAWLALGFGLAAFTYFVSPPLVRATVVSRVEDTIGGSVNSATGGRVEVWRQNISLLERNYVTGIGYKGMILQFHEAPDNMFFSALVETGVLGFTLFFGFLLALTIRLFREMRYAPNSLLPVLLMWFTILAIGTVTDVFTFWGAIPPVMGILGVVSAAAPRGGENASLAGRS